LRRYIAHEVETKIGRALVRGDIGQGGTVTVTVDGDDLAVAYTAPAIAA
jgi:ATP-dependent Clp protease ATP-binding subunit ClpB